MWNSRSRELIWEGLDVPRVHDVGPVLQHHKERFPAHFQTAIGKLASISRVLWAEREQLLRG